MSTAMASTSAPSSLAPGLARKVKKILELKTEAPDLISSLSTLSSFYDENTPAARRALRTTIEKRGVQINAKFTSAAETVIKALDEVQASLDGLTSSCQRISGTLQSTRSVAGGLLQETERLQRELSTVDRKAHLSTDFLEQYQLTPDEVAALQGDEVGPAFFAALARVRTIHEHCRTLLRQHHQRAGLELMDLMATYQETTYERLCRWVQGECRGLGEYDAPEVDGSLRSAVAALRERPVLFKYCAEEVATARHSALFQRFITALTRGGPGGVPRPIEIHAHDPKRYANDMLAWVHQALASEREFVVALFGDGTSGSQAPDARQRQRSGVALEAQDDGGDGLSSSALLDRIFESICRPLKVRVEQVLMTGPPLLLCFELAQLCAFYHGLITRIVGPSAQLSQALRSCRDMAQRVFLDAVKARGDKMLRNPPPPPKDLSPPPQVAETLHTVLEVVSAHESALQGQGASRGSGEEGSEASTSEQELGTVLGALLDPLVETCERSAEALTPDAPTRVDEVARLEPSARWVFLINCLSSLATALGHRSSTSQRARQLADIVEGHVAALVGAEVGRLLARCGMAEVVERMALYRSAAGSTEGAPSGVMAADPALQLPRVAEALRAFFVAVSSPDALPEFASIQVPRVRADAVHRVARSLCDAYEAVYTAVDDPSCGYGDRGGVAAIKHTPQQVRTILGVL